ncbi:MAG: hypothetical protein ABI402_00450 [Ferruginibacter sp.]
MNFFDYIVFIIYIIIFYIIFAWRRRKYDDPILRKYQRQGFWIKVFSCFAYCMFVLWISPGDTTGLYHPEGYNIYKLILNDPSNIKLIMGSAKDFDQALLKNIDNLGYFNEESNFMVTRIVTLLSFLTFGKFLAINLFFSMISFTGVWRLYRFFYEQYPELHKQFAIAILYFPTFVFWSSGILKDPLCTGALGWITYSLYGMFYKKKNPLVYIPILIFFSYLLVVLKVYIIVSYVPFFALFLLFKNVTLIKSKFAKVFIIATVLVGTVVGFLNITSAMQQALGNFASAGVSQSIKIYQNNYEAQAGTATSNFSLGVDFDGSAQSLVRLAPAAVIATLFRPYIWESKKLSTLLSSFESLALMLFTLFVLIKVGPKKFLLTIINKPIVLYCLMFSIIFALFVGATTLNFGSLVRYKIPAIPFYVIGLFFILYFNNKLKLKPREIAGPVVSTLSV